MLTIADIGAGMVRHGGSSSSLMDSHRIFQSHDLDETRDHIARTYCPHDLSVMRQGGQLGAWLNHRQLMNIGLGTMSYGADVEISGIEDQNFLLLMLPLTGQADIGYGSNWVNSNSEQASVISTVELDRMRWSQDCSQLVVQISTDAIDRQMTMMMGRALSKPVRFDPAMALMGDRRLWWNYVMLLLEELSGADATGARASIAHLETLLIVKLLETQPNNYSEQLQPQPCKIAPSHVRKVERYIIDNADRPIGLEELVEVSGVSARALFDGFRRFRGSSPMAYLRSVRLERVHDDLRSAKPGETVTTIACRWGFYQFGRFAGQYRSVYGELPSDTLRANA